MKGLRKVGRWKGIRRKGEGREKGKGGREKRGRTEEEEGRKA